MVLMESSLEYDSNGGHIIKIDENHALDEILGSEGCYLLLCSSYNLISDGDYWQFLVHSITIKGIWRLILYYTCC